MATFEYVEIPADAIRLKPSSLEPATKIVTGLPDTAHASASTWRPSEPLSPAKSALTLVPQMLLSASIPTSSTSPAAIISSVITTPNSRTPSHSLLSTRDPLSVPIMTANFRRFVSKIGPVFWLQDRIEEIILWRRGWKRTAAWIAVYGFICYFPKMALLIPHILLLAVMLHFYPDPGAQPVPVNVGEGSADWQANIQAIQNLMGAFSDAHDAIAPLLPLLAAPQTLPSSTTSQPKTHTRFSSTSIPAPSQESISSTVPKPSRHASDASNAPAAQPTAQPHHPFLIITLLSFLLLLPILMTELLPLRLLFFLAGAGGVGALHPRIKDSLSVGFTALSGSGPGLSFQLSIYIPRVPNPVSLLATAAQRVARPRPSSASSSCPPPPCIRTFNLTLAPRDVYLFLRRFTDDDRLDDTVWRVPLAYVELWENERWVQDGAEGKRRKSQVVTLLREGEEQGSEEDTVSMTSSTVSVGTVTGLGEGGKGTGGTWSKGNLKPSERVGWTRGRDGWSGIGGEISSNLTFSLSPGWTFIDTESWRPDLKAAWAVEGTPASASVCVGADEGGPFNQPFAFSSKVVFVPLRLGPQPNPPRRMCESDGWSYTTDTWTHPRPDPRPCDGWVTRRRRWVRRVYFKSGEP